MDDNLPTLTEFAADSPQWSGNPEFARGWNSALRDMNAWNASAAPSAQEVGRDAMPKGWRLETGVGGFGEKGTRWVCVRNLESQCGQDFYEDRDPLIFNFLWALAAIAKDTQ